MPTIGIGSDDDEPLGGRWGSVRHLQGAGAEHRAAILERDLMVEMGGKQVEQVADRLAFDEVRDAHEQLLPQHGGNLLHDSLDGFGGWPVIGHSCSFGWVRRRVPEGWRSLGECC